MKTAMLVLQNGKAGLILEIGCSVSGWEETITIKHQQITGLEASLGVFLLFFISDSSQHCHFHMRSHITLFINVISLAVMLAQCTYS